jgi:hypothetical protein
VEDLEDKQDEKEFEIQEFIQSSISNPVSFPSEFDFLRESTTDGDDGFMSFLHISPPAVDLVPEAASLDRSPSDFEKSDYDSFGFEEDEDGDKVKEPEDSDYHNKED